MRAARREVPATVSVILCLVLLIGGTIESSAQVSYESRQYEAALTADDLNSNLGLLLGLGDELVKTPSPQLSSKVKSRSAAVVGEVARLRRSGVDSLNVSAAALQVQDYLLTLRRETSFFASGEPQVAALLALQQAAAYQGLSARVGQLAAEFRGQAEQAAGSVRLAVVMLAGALAIGIGLLVWWDGSRRRRRRDHAALEVRAVQQSEIARLGGLALGGTPEDAVIAETVAAVSAVLSADRVSMVEVTHDTAAELGYAPSEALVLAGMRSTMAAAVRVGDHRYGVLTADASSPCRFTVDDVNFLQSCANILAGAIERRRTEAAVRMRATHDALTGLPNRTLLVDRLREALDRLRVSPGKVALMFIDVDRFKLVNDSMSHAAGDELLVQITARLREHIRASDTLARFGGDEFVVVFEESAELSPEALAQRLTAVCHEPFAIGDHQVTVDLCIGVATTSDPAADAALLIADADAAMYQAKEKGGGRVERFDAKMRQRANAHLQAQTELRRGLAERHFRLHYQPIVDLASGQITEVEALVRWEHPARGLIYPDEFIRAAEDSGLIMPLGEWILREACQQGAEWSDRGPNGMPIKVAVNWSARQVTRPGMVSLVRDTLAETGLDPRALTLEITETIAMDGSATTVECIAALRELGVQISIDDFGTGYSSLGYLKRLPVDTLKVDRAFVDGLGTDPNDAAIVEIVIHLAKVLGLRSVAEGVEDEVQFRELRTLGCDAAQGYLFSRPLAAEQVEALFGIIDVRGACAGPIAARSA